MSLSVEPDYQTFIDRFVQIHQNNALLFPNSIGGDNTAIDLVNQIIPNELPIPQLTIEGPGPPHIFVSQSRTPIIEEQQRGRDSRDVQGGKRMILEFYNIIISSSNVSRAESEKALYAIISAMTTTLNKNKRMTDTGGLNPLAATISYTTVPYIYDITQNETVAKNVVVRIVVGVNLR